MQYAICEGNGRWVNTAAKTLAGAKRAASLAQTFQGTDLFVAVRRKCVDGQSDGYDVVAKKLHRDALDMSATGGWQDEV